MKKTAIFFGSSMGNTEAVAEKIAKLMDADIFNVSDNPAGELDNYENLIFGSSTWGIGDLQDDWDGFISSLEDADLGGKTVAIFGLGDSDSYPDSFCDAVGTIYNAIENKGCNIVGSVSTDGYNYDATTAEKDGQLVGLLLDDDNESDKTDARIEAWVSVLKAEM